ncbi:MAG TPA: hypothetical protein VHM48_10215 [Candidatus Limnocylindrales bacterium]|nr:hypothetical protein [Candidatus Limnocylindrales bacterium]
MGLQYRAIRAAASVLLVAAAVGTGGMAGMTSTLAADPAMVALEGTVVDGDGTPLAGIHLVISEELPPDGGIAAFQTMTGADGTFAAEVYAWGTADAPASLAITTPADETVEIVGKTCSQTWGVELDADQEVGLADGAPAPLLLTATTTLLGEVCGTTATPPPDRQGAGGGQPGLTPPPTDTFVAPIEGSPDRLGPALTIGFMVGLLAAAALMLRPHPGSRRRD